MRILAIFCGSYSAAIFTAAVLTDSLDRLTAAGVCAAGAVLLTLLKRLLPDPIRRRALLCCVGLCLGMVWSWGYDRLLIDPVRSLDNTTVMLTGTISDWPEETDYGVRVILRRQLPKGGCKAMLLYVSEKGLELRPGDRVTTVAHCSAADRNGYGEATTYNTARGVFLTARAYGEVRVERPERPPISTWPTWLNRALQTGISRAFPADVSPLLRGMVTGDKTQLTDLQISALNRTGLSHTVVVSGLHVACLAEIITLLLGRGRRRTALVCLPVILLFTLMVGATPTAVRAAVMLILLQAAPLLGRESDTATSLFFALFLLLTHNPYAAASVNLQLSFASVAGIALFANRLNRHMVSRLRMPVDRPGHRIWNAVVSACCAVLATTLAVQVFTLPLVAYYFNSISLAALIANLLCLWAASFGFLGGVVCGLLEMVLPPAAAAAAWLWIPVMRYFDAVSQMLAAHPYAAIPADLLPIAAWVVLLYAVLVLALCLPGKKRMALPAGALAAALAAALTVCAMTFRAEELQVQVLDVGQGQSVLLCSEGRFALVDCGGDSSKNAGDVAADRLQSYGCTQLDLLVITHYHTDHANGIPELLKRIDVKCIALPDTEPQSELRQQILRQAMLEDIPVEFVREDSRFDLGRAYVTLYPPLGDEGDTNELGLTALCTAGDYDVLITGDMDSRGEAELVEYASLPDVELMVAGHHGSKYSNSTLLLERVRPEIAVFSAGAYNTYGHPAPETMERFSAVGAELYRTDIMGTVSITVGG